MSRPLSTGAVVLTAVAIALAGLAALIALPCADSGRPAGPAVAAEAVPAPTFHLPTPLPVYPGPASFCSDCHALPAHAGEGIKPVFYNDHSAFMECLLCHWSKVSGERPEPMWKKLEDGSMVLGLASPEEGVGIDVPKIREAIAAKQTCFDRGASCSTCHQRGGMNPYVKPGLSPQGQAALENLPDFFTISKGTKWYFPQLQ